MIELKNVEYKYKNRNKVLKNISCKFNDGECVVVIGRNGSGKSTLAKLMAGLSTPTSGEVIIDSINTKDKNKFIDIRKRVGIVFQNPENQIIFDKVYDDIIFAINNLTLDNKNERINEALNKVGMKEYINSDPYELSLGSKQKVAIAGVLALETNNLILDEPTTMLDSKSKKDIYNIIKNLKSKNITIVYTTNFSDEILLANRIVVIEKGMIVRDFNKKDILNNLDIFDELELELPTLLKLIINLKNKNINIDLQDFDEKEFIEKLLEEIKI